MKLYTNVSFLLSYLMAEFLDKFSAIHLLFLGDCKRISKDEAYLNLFKHKTIDLKLNLGLILRQKILQSEVLI